MGAKHNYGGHAAKFAIPASGGKTGKSAKALE